LAKKEITRGQVIVDWLLSMVDIAATIRIFQIPPAETGAISAGYGFNSALNIRYGKFDGKTISMRYNNSITVSTISYTKYFLCFG
jgi:hypothetical protein